MMPLSHCNLNSVTINTPLYHSYSKRLYYVTSIFKINKVFGINWVNSLIEDNVVFHVSPKQTQDICSFKFNDVRCKCDGFITKDIMHNFLVIDKEEELTQIELGMNIDNLYL